MIIDVILLVILGYFAFNGTRRGFINEISTVVALIAGFALANNFNHDANDFLIRWVRDDSLRFVLSYILIFTITVAILKIIATSIQKFLEVVLLGWLNRLLGLLLGILKGLLVISLFIFMMQSFPRAAKLHERMDHDSYLYHVCRSLKDWAITAIASNPNYEHYRDTLQEKIKEKNIQALLNDVQ
ncbi:MAG: CvpA family protein [FCB group bacterium]|nr:CvpA family protein [FCB group bacterium]